MTRRRKLSKQEKQVLKQQGLDPKQYEFVEVINANYIKVANKLSKIQKTVKIS